jgi:hypothetical protein
MASGQAQSSSDTPELPLLNQPPPQIRGQERGHERGHQPKGESEPELPPYLSKLNNV